ncbi:MAG: hypothetical protein LRY68_07690 [Sulfurospirillum sp.]|nr:hypothetical protein [Sulfurospirillum sp.]
MGYIKELMERFPNVQFKALGFNVNQCLKVKKVFGSDDIVYIEVKTIYKLFECIEVYLSNYERTYRNVLENGIVKTLRAFSTDVACIGLGLNQQHITVREHERNTPSFFGKIFDHLSYLGFTEDDLAKYGRSYHEVYFKKASEIYGVDINFNLDETVCKAYVYWNLKLGLKHHEFFQYSLEFGRKYAKL